MVDQRIFDYAKILTDYSIKIKKNDMVLINCGVEAKPLALQVYKNIVKKGGIPVIKMYMEGAGYIFYKYANDQQLKYSPEVSIFEAKKAAGVISIGTEYNTKEFTHIDPKKISIRSKVLKPVSEIALKKDNWVYCEYPTNALAQDAEMSLQEFEDFLYNACLVDWKKESKRQDALKKVVDEGEKVRIIGEDTDLSFSIKGRQGLKCAGTRNMPDGEVFVAPVERSVKGHVAYSFPAIKNGKEVDGIRLEFKNGKVVKAKASKNEKFLHAMINTDAGSKYLGEFGIGLNYNITKFIKQILFDEKIGGTIHLALGMAYKEGGGVNDSAIHWDMIKDLRKGGEFLIDDKVIQKNGKFRIKI